MFKSLKAFFRKWSPWEERVFAAVMAGMDPGHRNILERQLQAVNKIERICGWLEIDCYVMRRGRVNWQGVPAFAEDGEFRLAVMETRHHGQVIRSEIWCIGGHLFSIESSAEMQGIAFAPGMDVRLVELDARFAPQDTGHGTKSG